MLRLTLLSVLTAFAITFASGIAFADEGCDKSAKSGETMTKVDPPKPLTASTR